MRMGRMAGVSSTVRSWRKNPVKSKEVVIVRG